MPAPAPPTEQQWLGNTIQPTPPSTLGAMDNMAADYLQEATNQQTSGNRSAALAAAQSALIALAAADAIADGRGVAL